MSTRGLFGFVLDGKIKVSYNHSDSYPSYLGIHMCKSIMALKDIKDIKERIREIEMVEDDSSELASKVWDRIIEERNEFESNYDGMYDLLRENQGDLEKCIKNKAMLDDFYFGHDSLFCEWGYIWNLDKNTLEIYKGFQKENLAGRFEKDTPKDGYYGIALIKTLKIDCNLICKMTKFAKEYHYLVVMEKEKK